MSIIHVLDAVFAGLFGAAIASFLCVVAERVPKKESINGRSHCFCGRQLKNRENIPIIGWLLARGKTSCCNTLIPKHYIVSESSLLIIWFFAWLSLSTIVAINIMLFSAALLLAVCWNRDLAK